MQEPWVGVLATDSQSVLDTQQIGDIDPQEQDKPVDLDKGAVVLDGPRPDWDILIEIQALQKLPKVKLRHVKAHQDKQRSYQQLDLLGQLNVDADAQAGTYNLEFGARRPFVLMSPLARAHLRLPDGTVTGKYSTVLLHEASAKPLLNYIREKNAWNESTLQSINWEAHATAINRTPLPHTHIVKLLHGILPTHARANKFDGGTRTCEHTNRMEWRNKFLTGLQDLCIQSDTSPLLCGLIMDGIRQCLGSATT
jgi:hypothetical protein